MRHVVYVIIFYFYFLEKYKRNNIVGTRKKVPGKKSPEKKLRGKKIPEEVFSINPLS